MKKNIGFTILIIMLISTFTFVSAQEGESNGVKITDIEYMGNNQLKITSTGELEYTTGFLSDSNRLFFDIKDANLTMPAGSISAPDSNNIEEIRYAQNDVDPMITRIVFNQTGKFEFSSDKDGTTTIITIEEDNNQPEVESEPEVEPEVEPEPEKESNSEPESEPSGATVVIDAGHGGSDPGSVGNGQQEKVINLQIAHKLAHKLETQLNNLGYNVVMTRSGDKYHSLSDRVAVANNSGADIFFSIHANSFPSSQVSGIETYHHSGSSNGNRLASLVQEETIRSTGAFDRGIKSAEFLVLRETVMPATLIEVGFLSNPTEAELIADDGYQNKLVSGMVEGIQRYFN